MKIKWFWMKWMKYLFTSHSILFESLLHLSYVRGVWSAFEVPCWGTGSRRWNYRRLERLGSVSVETSGYPLNTLFICRVYIKQPPNVSSLWGFPYLPPCFYIQLGPDEDTRKFLLLHAYVSLQNAATAWFFWTDSYRGPENSVKGRPMKWAPDVCAKHLAVNVECFL